MTKIILLEGVDATGKTSAAELLRWEIIKTNRSCQIMREPEGDFRNLINDNNQPATNLMLFLASRAELCETLKKSTTDFVILDRFSPSTLAYQQNYFNLDLLVSLDEIVRNSIVPDFCFLFQPPFEEIEKRFANREGRAMNETENKNLKRINSRYKGAFRTLGWKYQVIGTTEYNLTGMVLYEHLKRNGLIV